MLQFDVKPLTAMLNERLQGGQAACAYGGGKIAEYRLGDDGQGHLAHAGG